MKQSVTISPDAILNSLQSVIKECNDSIIFGLNILKDVHEIPVETEEDKNKKYQESGIRMQVGKPETNIEKQKETYKNWLLKKGFEDLIKGVNLAVIEAYFLTKIQKFIGKTFDSDALNAEMDMLVKDALNQSNFPQLLKKLDIEPITYENAILSINKVRNCLVHRNGIVMKEKDINDKENNSLTLEYHVLEIVRVDENGKETERLENTGLGWMRKIKYKSFKVGVNMQCLRLTNLLAIGLLKVLTWKDKSFLTLSF